MTALERRAAHSLIGCVRVPQSCKSSRFTAKTTISDLPFHIHRAIAHSLHNFNSCLLQFAEPDSDRYRENDGLATEAGMELSHSVTPSS